VKPISLFVSILLLSACGLSEDKFIEKTAKKSCEMLFKCAEEEDIDPKFDDEGECREFIEGLAQPQGDEADCEYDGGAARDCLSAYDDMDCDDLFEGTSPAECDDVYSDECFD
jgi:hypothetical protein